MSVIFAMTSLAVAIGVTAAAGSISVVQAFSLHCEGDREIEPLETKFTDRDMLVRTLEEHGFRTRCNAQGDIIVETNVGSVRYYCMEEGGSYWAQAYDLVDEHELAEHMMNVQDEYLLNVQKSNYQRLKQQIAGRSDMHLESEEILEDDSILLTIQL